MSIHEKNNNFSKKTLMSRTKEELVNYALMMQENLIKMQHNLDIQYKNSKEIVADLEKTIKDYESKI